MGHRLLRIHALTPSAIIVLQSRSERKADSAEESGAEKRDHLRFSVETKHPVFFNRRRRGAICGPPLQFLLSYTRTHPIAPSKMTVPEMLGVLRLTVPTAPTVPTFCPF